MDKKPPPKNTGRVIIHGREYITVAARVQAFRDDYPIWTISTEIVERTPDEVVMKATITDEYGRTIGTGYAEEVRKSSQIKGLRR